MESRDNKTPRAVSGRPSLLSPPAGTKPDDFSHTRMLSFLEGDGKMPGPVSTGRRPSRRKVGIAALAVVLAAGVGAFFAFGPFDDASATVAAVPAPRVIPAAAPDLPASVAPAATAAAPVAASAAVAHIELAVASAPEPASAATVAQAASQPQVNPLDKLASRDPEAAAPAASAGAVASAGPVDKAHASVAAKRQAVASARPMPPHPVSARAQAPAAHKARKAEDDADTELVAAIIARLDKRGAKPAATAPVVASEGVPPNVANQVRQCSSNSDLLEARQCRNKACDGHWGKLDACPAARAPKTSRGDGADSGHRG